MSITEREMVAVEVDMLCDLCSPHGRMRPADGVVLTCHPPKYEHKCDHCGYVVRYLVCYPHIEFRARKI